MVNLEDIYKSLSFKSVDVKDLNFLRAEKRLKEHLSGKVDFSELGYMPEEVLENDDIYLFPIGWIGCAGYLIQKTDQEIVGFGSYISREAHLWAYYEGISLATLGRGRKNRISIVSVNDKEKTIKALKSFLDSQYVDREIISKLDELPLIFDNVDLYFSIRSLIEARNGNWFEFKISGYENNA